MAASYKKVKLLTVHLSTRQNVSLFFYTVTAIWKAVNR